MQPHCNQRCDCCAAQKCDELAPLPHNSAVPAFVRFWIKADIARFWLGNRLSAFDPLATLNLPY